MRFLQSLHTTHIIGVNFQSSREGTQRAMILLQRQLDISLVHPCLHVGGVQGKSLVDVVQSAAVVHQLAEGSTTIAVVGGVGGVTANGLVIFTNGFRVLPIDE